MNYSLPVAFSLFIFPMVADARKSDTGNLYLQLYNTNSIPGTGKRESRVFDHEKNFSPARVSYPFSMIAGHKARTSDEILHITGSRNNGSQINPGSV